MAAASSRRTGATGAPACAGFTLIEVAMVVLVMGLITALALPNFKAMVPSARLDAEARKLTANLDFLRSEARVQGKRYVLQLDLGNARWRMILPPEERLASEQTLEETQPKALDWNALEDNIVFAGAGTVANGIVRTGKYDLVFDDTGQTGDQMVYFKLADDETMVWTVQIRGLTGQTEILTDFEGREQPFELVNEMAF